MMTRLITFVLALLLIGPTQLVAQGTWEPDPTPVLVKGPQGSWDSFNVSHSAVVKVNGDYYMFYTGGLGGWYWWGYGAHQIGIAHSSDGVTWEKDTGNPYFSGAEESGMGIVYANVPAVLHDGALFHLWYSVRYDGDNRHTAIAYATSPDAREWTRHGIVMRPGPYGSFDDTGVHPGGMIFEDGLYKMWYLAVADNSWERVSRTAYATSPDGINWTKHGVVIDRGFQGDLDQLHAAFSSVLRTADGYRMAYDGIFAPGSTHLLGAHSPDGVNWTPEGILVEGGFYPDLVDDGTTLRLYVTGGPGTAAGDFDIYAFTWRPDDDTPPQVVVSPAQGLLWPPNGKTVRVAVNCRTFDDGSGVHAGIAEYEVHDEYGLVQPRGTFDISAAGEGVFEVSLVASRNGGDKDGRAYTVVVSVRDAAGNVGVGSATILVPHDRR